MVFAGESQPVVKKKSSVSMAVGHERTKPLHNFDLPCLKWGSQKYLRCLRVASDADVGSDRRSSVPRFDDSLIDRRRESEPERRKVRIPIIDGGEGIAAMREQVLLEIKTETEKMKDAIFRKGVAEAEEQSATAAAAAAGVEPRPWNLRTRRSACTAPAGGERGGGGGVKSSRIEDRKSEANNNGVKSQSPRLVRGSPEKEEPLSLPVALTRKEIEEDFMALVGHRPHRRPKKRPRIVQKDVNVSQSTTHFVFLVQRAPNLFLNFGFFV